MANPRKLTEEGLIDGAARVFARRGYDGTGIPDLLDELEISRPTLYVHTRGKEALVEAVFERVFAYYEPRLTQFVADTAPPLTRLRGLITLQVEAAGALHDSLVVALEARVAVTENQNVRSWWKSLDEMLTTILADAQKDGSLAATMNLRVRKHVIWAVLNDLPVWYRDNPRADELVEELFNLFVGVTGAVNAR